MCKIINGKMIASQIKDEIKELIDTMKRCNKEVTLAVVQVGDDPASSIYVRNKKKTCEYVGIRSISYELPEETTEKDLIDLINVLNNRDDVHGILVQLPLPKHINEDTIISAISPLKDVDGFHAINVGNLWIGNDGFVSCTPAGIVELLERSDIEIAGKKCVIVGRSNIVGKPLAALMLRENASVIICHSKTENLKELTTQADILIVAIGKPKFITSEYVKPNATVIDVGIHRLENGEMCGDVDYEDVVQIAGAITPVPGGVGPMTIALLMRNCLDAAIRNWYKK